MLTPEEIDGLKEKKDPSDKALRFAKKQLKLARRTARDTRIILLLSGLTLAVLVIAIVAIAKSLHG
jgi:hypothetical protein